MLVRTVQDRRAGGWEKVVDSGRMRSVRYITAADRVGFSLHLNESESGTGRQLWYKHHWEANFIVTGEAVLEDLDSGETWPVQAGSLYTVGPKDRHRLIEQNNIRLISVFCPALKGDETHDEDGAYPSSGEVPVGQERMFLRTVEEMRAAGKERVVANGQARSLRMLVKDDGIGFSFSDVHVTAGVRSELWYKNHWEANLVVGGEGKITEVATGREWPMSFGTMHLVGPPDRHVVECVEDLHVISVFCPPLQGDEQHDADGALEPSGPIPPGPEAG